MEDYNEFKVGIHHRTLPHLIEFTNYLLLFQYIFITIPMVFLNCLYHLISFTETPAIVGLLLLLFSPLLLGILVVLIVKRILGGDLSEDNYLNTTEHKFLTIMCYINGVIQFILYLFWFNGFDGHSWESFLLMLLTIYSGMPIAVVMYKKIKPSSKKNMGILLAGLVIGLIYAFTINDFVNIWLINSICFILLPWLLYLIQQNNYKFRYTSDDVLDNQYLWIPRGTTHKCQSVTMDNLLSMFMVIALGNVFSSVFYYSYDTALLSWIMLVFFIMMGVSHILIRFIPSFPTKYVLLMVLALIIIQMVVTEYVQALRFSIFTSIVSGFVMGMLLSEKIKFKRFNRNPDNTFGGYILAAFFAMALGILLTFVIVDDGDVYPTMLILNGLVLVFAFLTILFGFIRGQILKKQAEKESFGQSEADRTGAEKARLERERLEKERREREQLARVQIEKELLEKEQLERERIEQEKREREQRELEKERLKQEILERERLEREQLEKERIEREGLEQERIEKEKLEKERLEKERLEKEKLEQERLAENLKKERMEQERMEQEIERLKQARLENERLEKERLERERLEQERLEKERLERIRLEQERLEHERLEKERLEKEILEQKRIEEERLQLEKERIEEERLEKERIEKEHLEKERLEKERLEKERLEKERLEKERLEKERLEKEGLEKERLEKERLEKERLEKEENEKPEKERNKLKIDTNALTQQALAELEKGKIPTSLDTFKKVTDLLNKHKSTE